MTYPSLNKKILYLIGGLISATILAVLISVLFTTANHASQQLQKELEVGERIFRQVLLSREDQLLNSASVLTDDFGFKQAVASQDKNTIKSVLQNHGERIAADIMSLISLEGELMASTVAYGDNYQSWLSTAMINNVVQNGGATSFIVINQRFYQVILLTVDAPTPIAIALMGFEVDTPLLQELKEITKLDVTISARNEAASSVSKSSSELGRSMNYADFENSYLHFLSDYYFTDLQYVSKHFLLSEAENNKIWIVLSDEISEIFKEFNWLHLKITLITIVSLAIAMALGIILARRLTHPLSELVTVAERVAMGDYQNVEHDRTHTLEIHNLSNAFNVMQDHIKAREDKIRYQSSHDLLTKLYNRNTIVEYVDQKFAKNMTFQAIGLNIVGFRNLNDTFGTHLSDRCLQILAQRIEKLMGLSARLNGGEFLWLPEKVFSHEELQPIKTKLEQPISIDHVSINMKLAIGVLSLPDDASSTADFMRRLNIVLESAKSSQRLFSVYLAEMEDAYLYRLKVLGELKIALTHEQGQLDVFYQPKLSLRSLKVEKMEALMRWQHPELGFISPEVFIPIAEQSGLINQLTYWVIERVAINTATWLSVGLDLQIAINLSVHDIINDNLLDDVARIMTAHAVPKYNFSFEITESDVMTDPAKAITLLNRFRDNGFNLAIDDFGTGYSSLAYLKDMPVTELKVDKSFVLNLSTEVNDQTIVQSIISLAKSFNLEIVAEGVEDEVALSLLKKWGVEWIQGYYISRPMRAEDAPSWMKENNNWKF